MLSRRQVLSAAAAWLVAGSSHAGAAGDRSVVEDWKAVPLGHHGIPPGWRPYETPGGHPRYDFTIVEDGGRRALRMRSESEHSTIARELTVDLASTPILTWSWKVVSFPAGADLRERATSDATGHLFVIWPRFPEMLRSRLIGYVWEPRAPADAVFASKKTGTVTYVVVRSGTAGTGAWVDERRDVAADYRRIYGGTAPNPPALALSIDTNDTRSHAESLVGALAFQAR
ncbi:MAG TPA: DUF3047 domain-containing protein [Solirubrobacteraceae bacterium]